MERRAGECSHADKREPPRNAEFRKVFEVAPPRLIYGWSDGGARDTLGGPGQAG